jgi:predicted DNA-binding protein (MmcQ/YjbR family)
MGLARVAICKRELKQVASAALLERSQYSVSVLLKKLVPKEAYWSKILQSWDLIQQILSATTREAPTCSSWSEIIGMP